MDRQIHKYLICNFLSNFIDFLDLHETGDVYLVI
jgi:hypothetical protein